MTTHDDTLLALLLDGTRPSAATRRWLATPAGRRARRAYQRTLRALDRWARQAGRARIGGPAHATPLYYARLRTPIGHVRAAVSDTGVVRVSFREPERAFLAALRRRHGTVPVHAPARLAPVVRQLEAYLAGRRRTLDLPVDLRHVTPFQHRVLTAARRIPRGTVVSYGELARRIRQPRASRAVGQALGRNPVPIVVPCHRVVAGGGEIGGYTGGLAIKRRLLAIEGLRAVG